MPRKDARKSILDSARNFFYKYGFKRVSIEEICREAGVSRKTFYVYFPNKNELAIEILKQIFDSANSEFISIMESEEDFASKMSRYIQFKAELTKSISMEFANDIFNSDIPEISDYYKKINEQGMELTRSCFQVAQENFELRSDLSIDMILYVSDTLMNLCNEMQFQALFASYEDMMSQVTKMFIYGIIGNTDISK